jgi:hypothetical protein
VRFIAGAVGVFLPLASSGPSIVAIRPVTLCFAICEVIELKTNVTDHLHTPGLSLLTRQQLPVETLRFEMGNFGARQRINGRQDL